MSKGSLVQILSGMWDLFQAMLHLLGTNSILVRMSQIYGKLSTAIIQTCLEYMPWNSLARMTNCLDSTRAIYSRLKA